MGCDIHAQLERKWPEETWDNYVLSVATEFDIDRNYLLFGYLAGVRNYDVVPIIAPKGLPKSVSFSTRDEYEKWDSDAHTPSWLTFKELKKLPKQFKKEDFYKVMEVLAKNHGQENVRMVFWFDN